MPLTAESHVCRLDVAIQVMHEARNKLAAKMALKDLNL